jgi:L(+)-tartrate dehydratase alpha subunit
MKKLLEDGINAISVAVNVGDWNYVRGHIVFDKGLNFTLDIHNSFEYREETIMIKEM